MTEAVEVIDNHTYLVMRDDSGNIISQLGRDPIGAPVEQPLATLVAKADNLWTPTDLATAIKYLIRRG